MDNLTTSAPALPPQPPPLSQPAYLEIRLFYVRIAPCMIDAVPDHLTLRHPRREMPAASIEINGSRIAADGTASLTLRRDRLDKESSEVTYVSTETVRFTGTGVEFEVHENGDEMLLCGSIDRVDGAWSNGWEMDCYVAVNGNGNGGGVLKMGLTSASPTVEVYIAGCCGGVPVILTKTVQVSPRRKMGRQGMLDAIPEDEEVGIVGNGLVRQRKLQIMESPFDDYEFDGKIAHGYYPEDMYAGEDGQLSWFNAGVRVGVGIGLGMCLGIGIGVGLLMRSYQATTRNFRRRFL